MGNDSFYYAKGNLNDLIGILEAWIILLVFIFHDRSSLCIPD